MKCYILYIGLLCTPLNMYSAAAHAPLSPPAATHHTLSPSSSTPYLSLAASAALRTDETKNPTFTSPRPALYGRRAAAPRPGTASTHVTHASSRVPSSRATPTPALDGASSSSSSAAAAVVIPPLALSALSLPTPSRHAQASYKKKDSARTCAIRGKLDQQRLMRNTVDRRVRAAAALQSQQETERLSAARSRENARLQERFLAASKP